MSEAISTLEEHWESAVELASSPSVFPNSEFTVGSDGHEGYGENFPRDGSIPPLGIAGSRLAS